MTRPKRNDDTINLTKQELHTTYATKYQWGYLHEAMEVDGDNRMELFFTPSVDQDTHALFLRQIAETDPQARHIVIADQAGFHLKPDDKRVPANMRLLPLPPYSPELNPVKKLGDHLYPAGIADQNNIFSQLFRFHVKVKNGSVRIDNQF